MNKIIFTLARMNPPTPGHLYLIQRLIEEGIKQNVENVYIILSKTNDNNDNPISCEEKIKVLGNNNNMIYVVKKKMIELEYNDEIKTLINNINVVSICVPDIKGYTPFTVISGLINKLIEQNINNIDLFVIIGDDRVEMLDSIADAYFFRLDQIYSINGLILNRKNMDVFKSMTKEDLIKLNVDTVPIDAFSASFIRKIVKYGLKSQFDKIYSPYLTQDIIDELYSLIENGLELPDDKKKSVKTKLIKYTYPLIKSLPIKKSISVINEEPNDTMPKKRRRITGGKRKSIKSIKSRKSRKSIKSRKVRIFK